MRSISSLAVFIAVVLGIGLALGFLTAPGDWYAGLQKPWFNPPNWLFGPVWTILYVLIAIAGWRTWRREPAGPAMTFWAAQMLLNFAWSPAFFAARMPALALIVIVALLATILAFIWLVRRPDPTSALLFAPYAAWVGFATLLNAAIVRLN